MRRRMKGRKEEKRMGPLFPRLHIKDTERAGPRAPPRNKMALYEQLSIPSQRCSAGQTMSLPQPSTNGSILVPPASSSKAVNLNVMMGKFERNSIKNANCPPNDSRHHLSSTTGYGSLLPHDFSNSRNSCGSKIGDVNDLRLHEFVHSKVTESSSNYPHSIDQERHTKSSPSKADCSNLILENSIPKTAANSFSSSMQLRNSREKHLKRTNTTDLTSRHGENTSEPSKHRNVSFNQDDRSGPVDIKGEDNIDAQNNQKYKARFLLKNSSYSNVFSAESKKRNVSNRDGESCPSVSLRNGHESANEAENGRNYCEEKVCTSLQMGNMDIIDDTSEAYMVDSISGLKLSPNDVVGVLGQKKFWNTRRAILNQQRLFMVQVFELHRLIKVQRLIAGSPELLREGNPCFGKSSEIYSAKELPSQYVLPKTKTEDESQNSKEIPDSAVVKPPDPSPRKLKAYESQKQNQSPDSAVVKRPDPSPSKIMAKDESQQQNQGRDSTVLKPRDPSPPKIMAEDESQKSSKVPDAAVVKPPGDGLNKLVVTQHPSHGPYSGNLLPPPVAAENKVGPPWCFNPPPVSQMVLPVMPHSERLIHEPSAGAFPQTAGFMAPIYGGWGSMAVPSMAGGCLNPAFGFPGISNLSCVAPAAQAYPPVMTTINSALPYEEGSSLVEPRPDWKAEQLSTGAANFGMKSGSLSNILNQNDETISCVKETQAPRDGELQDTILTGCERAAEKVAVLVCERDFTLFPKTPALVVSDRVPQTASSNQQTPVIRVVPHNPRTATESAARIFRCIQEERKQHYVPV